MPAVDLDTVAKRFNAEGPKRAAVRGLRSAALRGVQEIVTFIIPSRSPQPVDRGVYRAGWRTAQLPNGATIENLEPHAVFIEYGVKRVRIGAAAFAALVEWVVRKGLADSTTALTVAKRIAWAMKRRGTIFGREGMGVLKELVEGNLSEFIRDEVGREVAAELARAMQGKQ